jgi:Na+-transporting methylmalonyl-CoA/oxaloacetate decarboxylase gamma subunit
MPTINNQFRVIFSLLLMAGGSWPVHAQTTGDLRFNELLVWNDSGYVDDFGRHSPWIEIFNPAYNTVDIGGCFLTNDPDNPVKYWIPTGDPATRIPPRCYVVFWADNKPTRGIFHLNFELAESEVIALFDASGRTLIDKVEISLPQKKDITYGRPGNEGVQWVYLDKSTPGANNDFSRKPSSGEKFVEMDPSGLGMTLIAMSVVFSALVILYLIYKNIGRYFVHAAKPKRKRKPKTGEVLPANGDELSGEVSAAIALAIYLYRNELHDRENTVLTIKKVSRTYSPWSSKIHTLRKTPR